MTADRQPASIIDHPYRQGMYGHNACIEEACGRPAEAHRARRRCEHDGDGLRHACIHYYKDGCQHCTGGCYEAHY